MKHLLKLFSLFTIITMMTTALVAPVQTFASQDTMKEKMDNYKSMKMDHQKMMMKDKEALKNAKGFEEKKVALVKILKLNNERLTKLGTHLTERQCGSPEAASTAISSLKTTLTDAQTAIEATTTIDELRAAHMQLKESVQSKQQELKNALKTATKGCILDRVAHILEMYTTEQSVKAQEKIDMLKADGNDTSMIEVSFTTYKTHMEAVQALYTTASTATEVSRDDLKAIKDELHDAKDAWEDMIKDMKKLIKNLKNNDDDDGDDGKIKNEDKSEDGNDDENEGGDENEND